MAVICVLLETAAISFFSSPPPTVPHSWQTVLLLLISSCGLLQRPLLWLGKYSAVPDICNLHSLISSTTPRSWSSRLKICPSSAEDLLLCCSRRRPGAAGRCGGLRVPIGCGVSARCLLCVRNHPTTSPLLPSPPASPADVPPDHLPSPLVLLVLPPMALQGAMPALCCMRRPSPGREGAACDWGTAPTPAGEEQRQANAIISKGCEGASRPASWRPWRPLLS